MICDYTHLSHKAVMMELSSPYNKPSASLSVLLYLFSVLDRIFLTNAMGLSMLFSGIVSLGQLGPLLACSMLAPSHTPEASVSIYNGLVSS